jgi:hypothetical protein
VSGAQSGTVASGFPDNIPVEPALLQNVRAFADKTTAILVKDADVTDLSIQLQNAPPAPGQSAVAPTAPTAPSDPD